jgi:altronate dehydratase small subunit
MKGTVIDDRALLMTGDDTVATALADLAVGERLETDPPVTIVEAIPFGHKVALVEHDPGDPVIKYGDVIGEATTTIDCGDWVHTHNCASRRGRGDRKALEPDQ